MIAFAILVVTVGVSGFFCMKIADRFLGNRQVWEVWLFMFVFGGLMLAACIGLLDHFHIY